MTRARKALICLDDTPYYHCTTRCVRRAFLCGEDHYSGNSYEHRRGWIVERLKLLGSAFSIDIAAYAIMSNHYHLVLRVDRERAEEWTSDEVIERWRRLFAGPELIQRYLDCPQQLSTTERRRVDAIVAIWRERLADLSWFMRCLNEWIARRANREDNCKGRFWEGRFDSRALLDDIALLTCMAYVDLNPIRAGMAATPEESDYTSLQERLGIEPEPSTVATKDQRKTEENEAQDSASLLPFAETLIGETPHIELPFGFEDYLQLVEWTGRAVLENKRGAIPEDIPPMLQRFQIDPKQWLKASTGLEQRFGCAIGPIDSVTQLCQRLKICWLRGITSCRQLYGPPKPAA